MRWLRRRLRAALLSVATDLMTEALVEAQRRQQEKTMAELGAQLIKAFGRGDVSAGPVYSQPGKSRRFL